MKIFALLAAAALAAPAAAFAPGPRPSRSTSLHVATRNTLKPAKRAIDRMTRENFAATLAEVEPFLLNDAGASIYKKSMKRIKTRAKRFKMEVPKGYAKEAKATEKKRAKQAAYLEAKAAEKAEAAAADADADAAEAAE